MDWLLVGNKKAPAGGAINLMGRGEVLGVD